MRREKRNGKAKTDECEERKCEDEKGENREII